jgi:hypothetical protein
MTAQAPLPPLPPLRRLAVISLLSLAALGLPACSRYAAPSLDIVGTRLADERPGAIVLVIDFDAQNTNEIELPLREIDYTVSLDGREVFRGVRSPEATLRRLGSQSFSIPAVLVFDPADRPVGPRRYIVEGELKYTTPGEIAQILFDTGVRRPTIAFRDDGVIDFGPAPPPSSPPLGAPLAPAAPSPAPAP